MGVTCYVGARVHRADDPVTLVGRSRYLADLRQPGQLDVAFVRSLHAHARIRRIDVARAAAMPGVVAVMAGDEAARMCRPWRGILAHYTGMKAGAQLPLAVGKVRFVGEPVAAVVAANRYLAEDACDAVQVEYDPLPAVTEAADALKAGAPILHEDLGDNLVYHKDGTAGDVAGAFAAADRVIRDAVDLGRHTGVPLDPRGCLALFEPLDRSLTLWSSSQVPFVLRSVLAELLGLEEPRIRILSPAVGGGFGVKLHVYQDEITTCLLAMKLGRPVRWIADRHESFLADIVARDERVEVEAAVRGDGTILGMRARILSGIGAYSVYPRTGISEGYMVGLFLPGPYTIQNYDFSLDVVHTNTSPLGHYRGVGGPAAVVAMEGVMDGIARELGLDPAEVRMRNMVRAHQFPYRTATGFVYDSGSYVESLQRVMDVAGYRTLREEQARGREAGRCLGIGLSTFVEITAPSSRQYGIGGAPISAQDGATVRFEPDGRVTAIVGTPSQGQGLRTAVAQVVAEELQVPLESITVLDGDTATNPHGGGLWGSRGAVVVAGAAMLTAQAVRQKLFQVAGHLLEANADDLELVDGTVRIKGSPSRSLPLVEVTRAAYFKAHDLPPGLDPGLEATRHYEPPQFTFTNGAHLALVEVDRETGGVRLLKYVSVEDCGRMINPMLVEGQVQGGIAQGVGAALFEYLPFDAQGQPMATSLMDYLLPTAADLCDLEVDHLETPSPFSMGGFKGIGEAGTVAAPAAIANAVNDALAPLGVRITDQPVTPERLYQECAEDYGRKPVGESAPCAGV